jgi:hypothetical protein
VLGGGLLFLAIVLGLAMLVAGAGVAFRFRQLLRRNRGGAHGPRSN